MEGRAASIPAPSVEIEEGGGGLCPLAVVDDDAADDDGDDPNLSSKVWCRMTGQEPSSPGKLAPAEEDNEEEENGQLPSLLVLPVSISTGACLRQ